ncbi:signal recognition particle-docking protein FtsY, partial [Candidatus Woesearchaeota archaeon CG_4_10_14_0_8_um_filter_47_5]
GQQQKKQKKESAPETEKSSQKIPRKPVPAPEAGKSPHSILPREKPQEKHISSSLPVPSPQSLTQKPQKKEAAEKSAMHAPEPAPALSPASKEILEKKESRVQDESEEEKEITSLPPQQARKPSFFSKLKETFGKKEQVKAPEKAPESAPEPTPPASSEHDSEIPRGFFGSISDRISKKVLSEKQFEELFWELEVVMLENNVALEVIEKIKEDLARELVGKPLLRSKLEETVAATLKHSVESLFEVGEPLDLLARAAEKKPLVICFVGINGSGKTTTIAKLCHMFQKHHMSCVIAAGDTFRAAAIDQLQVHAQKLGVRLIKHDYGSDPAAVAFDAIAYAKANNKDVVLIDTAGRQHSNRNLMDELKKVKRVNNPDLIIFVGESITGNDCVEQAREFDAAVGINGIILTKADV